MSGDVSRPESYDALVASAAWRDALDDLNQTLRQSLEAAGENPVLQGNVFYHSHQERFWEAAPDPEMEVKRRNLFVIAQNATHLFEIGVNGGHSLLLMLMANPALKAVGVDICQRVQKQWAPVEVYTPVAGKWLEIHFPGRVRFITGNSLIETPRYAVENPKRHIDAVHLDGAKVTHFRELVSIRPVLTPDAFIVHDDTGIASVKKAIRQEEKLKMIRPVEPELGIVENDYHRVYRNWDKVRGIADPAN
ncbi:MAG: class I SAM-dependent methyltransferase [Pseudomonadota bacterium]